MSLSEQTKLLDAKRIQREYGLTRNAAYHLIHELPQINLENSGLRRVFVRREDFEALLAKRTVGPE